MNPSSKLFRRSLIASGVSATLLLAACGGGDGGGSNKTIGLSGSIGDGYQIARAPGLLDRLAALVGVGSLHAQQALDAVDQVVAIPTKKGNVDEGIYALIEQSEIQDDGSFDLELDTHYDWVLLLVNSQAQVIDDKVVAYISIPATTDEGLDDVPASNSNGKDIDLGKIQPNASHSRQADSSNDAESLSQSLTLTSDELRKRAQYDDSYRHLYNFYLNYNPDNGNYYLPMPEANWVMPLPFTGLSGNTKTDSSTLGSFRYDGFHASILTDSSPSIDLRDFCNATMDFGVYPPASVSIEGVNFDMGAPMSNQTQAMNQWSSTYCGNDFVSISEESNGQMTIRFPLGESQIPAGLWRMKQGNELLAAFDFSLANPATDSGAPHGLAPKFTLLPDADDPDRIAAIRVQWYRFDGNAWVEVTGNEVDKLVYTSFIELADYRQGDNDQTPKFLQYDENDGLIRGEITLPSTHAWYLANKPATLPDNAAEVTELKLNYEMAGISYSFIWSKSPG